MQFLLIFFKNIFFQNVYRISRRIGLIVVYKIMRCNMWYSYYYSSKYFPSYAPCISFLNLTHQLLCTSMSIFKLMESMVVCYCCQFVFIVQSGNTYRSNLATYDLIQWDYCSSMFVNSFGGTQIFIMLLRIHIY